MSWFNREKIKKNYKEGEAGFDYGASNSDFSENDKKKILAVIESLPDGILIFDENKSLLLINFQAQLFLNITGADVLGKNVLELSKHPFCRPLISVLGGGIIEVKGEKIELKTDLILEVLSSPLMAEGR
ncbi:MAG: PAS domain-containing protein, partial [Candidatus Nealsonbacteria bacterium]|nr:PAS domain-containing protein [Candidatus Nealsonbacteria bacterium]